MRICHVVEAAGGGSGRVVLDLVHSGIEAGNDITLIYSPNRVDSQFVAGLSKLNPRAHMLPLPMDREVGWRDIAASWKLYRLLRKVGPFDIIHGHSSKAGALCRIAGLLIRKTAMVYTPHAFMTMDPNASRFYGWIEWILSWFGSAIICVSPQELQHAREDLKISKRKLHIIVNGVHLDYPATRSSARSSMGFSEQDFVIGCVARMVPQKNPSKLIDVFALASKQQPNLRLAIVGDGALLPEVKQAVENYGLKDHVHFMGGLTGRDLMPGFDCLLCVSDYESFGLVLLEAMAAGVPPISTPVGIAEEAIIPEITGYVTPDFSTESLAAAIIRMASLSPATRAEMANDAIERAKNFSLEHMTMQTFRLYRKLVARRRR